MASTIEHFSELEETEETNVLPPLESNQRTCIIDASWWLFSPVVVVLGDELSRDQESGSESEEEPSFPLYVFFFVNTNV